MCHKKPLWQFSNWTLTNTKNVLLEYLLNKIKTIVIGAGPAGLTAAWEIVKQGGYAEVIEKYHLVGGIARTESHNGYSFDIGGHRFFTKVTEAADLWQEWMGADLLIRPRKSRIFYNGKFFYYPLRAINALFGLGLWESFRIVVSYIQSQIFPYRPEDTFEQWVCNRFGKRLYEIFFKTYTEKVWGIPCSEIRAEWAAQRIKGLSLPSAVRNALFPPKGEIIKTLIEEFYYPRLGPGMMWERVRDLVCARDGAVSVRSEVIKVWRDGQHVEGVVVRSEQGERNVIGTDYISTIPLSDLISKFDPPAPPNVIQASQQLAYRDFLTIVLIINEADLFPDNWIYIHSADVMVGRIQNYKNWSPDMVPDSSKTSVGLEYFCDEGDKLWNMSDEELIALGASEIHQIGLAQPDMVVDGVVVRQVKAYPIYNSVYNDQLAIIKNWLSSLDNFHTVGRNGLHKYNNQDHSMLTAILAVRNIIHGERHDVWNVNTERSYHEEMKVPSARSKQDQAVDILEA